MTVIGTCITALFGIEKATMRSQIKGKTRGFHIQESFLDLMVYYKMVAY